MRAMFRPRSTLRCVVAACIALASSCGGKAVPDTDRPLPAIDDAGISGARDGATVDRARDGAGGDAVLNPHPLDALVDAGLTEGGSPQPGANDASGERAHSTIVAMAVSRSGRVAEHNEPCRVNDAVVFTAQATMSDGTTRDVTNMAKWLSSSNDLIVQGGGRGLCLSGGRAIISASVADVRGELEMSVEGPVVSEYVITGPSVMRASKSAYFHLFGRYGDGRMGPAVPALWETSDAAVLLMTTYVPGNRSETQFGLAQGRTPGSALVTATLGGVPVATSAVIVTSSAAIESLAISPASLDITLPANARLSAIATFSDGTQADVAGEAHWFCEGGVVQVHGGTVVGVATGVGRVTATVDDVSVALPSTVTVWVGTPIAIELSQDIEIPAGISVPLSASGRYEREATFEIARDVTWHLGDPAIGTVTGSTFVGRSPGRTTYGASWGSLKSDERSLVVTTATLVELVLRSEYLSVGATTILSVTGVFDDRGQMDVTQDATFSTADALVATVSSDSPRGRVLQATGVGTTTLTAVVGGVSTTATVTVDPRP